MENPMTRKIALVTGASSGIGEATARQLAQLGFTVYAAARRVDRMSALTSHDIRPVALDVTDDSSMTRVMADIIAAEGRLDVLVNNAGYGSYGALEDVPLDEARAQFDVNVFGLARLTQLALPHMRAQGDGHIINISSVGGKIWEPLGSWYHATKFAVEGLSDSLRAEVAGFGIKVVVIEPGIIKSEWAGISADTLEKASAGSAYESMAQMMAHNYRTVNDGRLASEPEVVAKAIGRAATSARPRTRYAVGGGAPIILLINRLLSDRGFDRFMTRQAGIN
jgi:NAD(P)-dependent dehydrogenase (short-subunit alcohol dehydrogenase family)